ncbi:MAG TPA: SIMPL domain-containing protein [Patescibacteria group bacterium]|nr:SIMPL domain-containing protein [Patescibacteria group bacterium]
MAANSWPTWKENRPFATALFILVVFLIAFVGAKTVQAIRATQQIDEPVPYEHSIMIEGEGRASAKPDVAIVSLTIESKGADVSTTQKDNTAAMNKLIEAVKAAGIPEDDIQTANYNSFENMEWDTEKEESVSKGWIVTHQISVKIRNTEKISDLLAVAGKNGATTISGPNFTIDDTSNLKDEARKKALAQAQQKAKDIAKALGLRLERVISYNEWVNSQPTPWGDFGKGGQMMTETMANGPLIQTGMNELVLTVNLSYKLVE